MTNQRPGQEQLQEAARQQAQFMARVWSDADFKRRLLDDPRTVLQEQGIPVPEGMEIRVVENTEDTVYLVLPPERSAEISDEQLEMVADGKTLGTAGSVGTLLTMGTVTGALGTAGSVFTAGTAGTT